MECCHPYRSPSDLSLDYQSDPDSLGILATDDHVSRMRCAKCSNHEQTILELETLLSEQRREYLLKLEQLQQKHNKLKQMYLEKKRYLKQSIESKLKYMEQVQNTRGEMKRLSDKNHQILQEKHDAERERDDLEKDKFNLHLQMVAQQKTIHELQLMQIHRKEAEPVPLYEIQRSKSATDLESIANEVNLQQMNMQQMNLQQMTPHSTRSQKELPAIYEQAEQLNQEKSDTPTLEQPIFISSFSVESDEAYFEGKSGSYRNPVAYYGYRTPKTSVAYPFDGLSFNKRMSFRSTTSAADTPISPLSHWNAASYPQLSVDSDGVDVSADDEDDRKDKEPSPIDVEYLYKKEIEELNTTHALEKESMMKELNQLKAKVNEMQHAAKNKTDSCRVRKNSDGMKLQIMITTDTTNT